MELHAEQTVVKLSKQDKNQTKHVGVKDTKGLIRSRES
jgi:hypothetical protein